MGKSVGYSEGYAAGYQAAKDGLTLLKNQMKITNTAANYMFAEVTVTAYIDGVYVKELYASGSAYFPGVGQ